MQAVIAAGGKQYLVSENEILNIDLLAPDSKKLEFSALMTIDGKNVKVGTPTVSGAKVTAEVVTAELKGEKIKILRFKAKKRVKRLTGHRQKYTQIKILTIA